MDPCDPLVDVKARDAGGVLLLLTGIPLANLLEYWMMQRIKASIQIQYLHLFELFIVVA
jgi:hypothetical protein